VVLGFVIDLKLGYRRVYMVRARMKGSVWKVNSRRSKTDDEIWHVYDRLGAGGKHPNSIRKKKVK